MRIIETKAYSFEELSEEAKNFAFEKWYNSEREYFWMDDNLESIKKGLLHFDFELKDYSIDYWCATNAYIKIESRHSYDEVEELSGVRLWKYLHNYMKVYCKYKKEYINLLEGDCPFTGYCADENFLDPIREFMKQPKNITFKELMEECVHKGLEVIENDYEYQNSREFFEEEVKSNGWEFTEEGKRI